MLIVLMKLHLQEPTAKVKEFEHEGSVAVVTKSQDDGDEQKYSNDN